MARRLSPKHQAFVNEYLTLFNATEAYVRVYHPESRDGAAASAATLLRNPKIAEAIDERLSEEAMRPAEVLRRLGEQARAKQSDYLTDWGSVDFKRILDDGKGHLIKSMKHTAHGLNIEFYDAQAALSLLGKHHGLLGAKGTSEDPVNTVEWTREEWEAEMQRRRQAAAETTAEFEQGTPDVDTED